MHTILKANKEECEVITKLFMSNNQAKVNIPAQAVEMMELKPLEKVHIRITKVKVKVEKMVAKPIIAEE